jgi:hypothetical protein
VLGLVSAVLWVVALIDVLQRSDAQFPGAMKGTPNANERLVWILVVLLGNGIGAIVYYFVVMQPYPRQREHVGRSVWRTAMRRHTSDEFGKVVRTDTNVSIGLPEHGQFEAPTFILQKGLEENARAERGIATPRGVPVKWVVIAVIVIALLGAALLVWGFGTGGFDPPPELTGEEWIN